MKVWAGLMALGMLAAAPAASATLLNRNFLGAVPAAQWTSADGVGVFDPVDPNNTCAALLGVRSEDLQNFYYTNLRMGAGVFDSGTLGGASVPADGTPLDDCLALVPTADQEIGTGDFAVVADFFYNLRGILGVTETAVLSNDTWSANSCDLTSTVVQGAPALLPITGVTVTCAGAGAAVPLSSFVTATAAGSVSTGFDEPNVVDLGVATSSVVQTCYTAALFDSGTGIIAAPVSDETWMFVLTADASAAGGVAFASALDSANNLMNQDNLVANDSCA